MHQVHQLLTQLLEKYPINNKDAVHRLVLNRQGQLVLELVVERPYGDSVHKFFLEDKDFDRPAVQLYEEIVSVVDHATCDIDRRRGCPTCG